MKNTKQFFKLLRKSKKGQGATEYILLLVAVVAMIMIFKEQITGKMRDLVGNVSSQIDSVANPE